MTDNAERQLPEVSPCRHMETWIDALADDSLTGFARWYTQIHVAGCRRCRAALQALRTLRERLKSYREASETGLPPALSPEKRSALEAALDAVEKQRHRF